MMYVYSGECRLCRCGLETKLVDVTGQQLMTGDIVIIFKDTYVPNYLTVVVADEFQTYSDGTHKKNTDELDFYIMGIKGAYKNDDWGVLRVKGYSHVVDGEHWPEFGFRFVSVEEQADGIRQT